MFDCLFCIRSSRLWCEEERGQFFEATKNYPSLYDTSNCKTYQDITVKTNAKLTIEKLFENCSVEDVTVQWGYLEDKFRKKSWQQNVGDPTGTSAEESSFQLPHWDLYQRMPFLEHHIKQRT